MPDLSTADGNEAGEWDFITAANRRDDSTDLQLGSISKMPVDPRAKEETSSLPSIGQDLTSNHNLACPPSPEPPPATHQPPPLRYPETLGAIIEVRSSEEKGLGVFALCDIPAGTILLSEAPLVTLVDTGTRADPLDATLASLLPRQRASFLSLHAFTRNKNESLHRSIVYSNGYSINADLATGVFETASRINHSCVPNSMYVWKEKLGRMIFWNRFKLFAGEEVCVDYGHKRAQLKRIYGFDCMCGGCTEEGTVVTSTTSGSICQQSQEKQGIEQGIIEAVGPSQGEQGIAIGEVIV